MLLLCGAFPFSGSSTESELPAIRPAASQLVTIPLERIDSGPSPMDAQSDWTLGTYSIPAPRSIVLSSDGEVLARNRIGWRLSCRLGTMAKTADEAIARITALPAIFSPELPFLRLSEDEIRKHFQNRRWIPIPVTDRIDDGLVDVMKQGLPDDCTLSAFYRREYPQGELTAHLLGYIGVSLPDQHGPIGKEEYDFPPTEGRAGMEKSLDAVWRGQDGEVLRLVDSKGVLRHQDIVRKVKPGDTVVLTIHLGMQKLAKKMLERTGRSGAFVAVDADTGNILALVSHPSFNPNLFEGGISQSDYDALSASKDAPLFDRAVSGAYPPGSTFKPFVALAGMDSGVIDGAYTLYPGPAGMMIGGRYFKNHSSFAEGPMDVRYALIRSCNTWFYQAGLDTGASAIAEVSRRFGFGTTPELPLPSISSGNIPNPDTYNDPRSLANFAIGQGQVLVSPVQLALAMSGLANGRFVPKARLVKEMIDPRSGQTSSSDEPAIAHALNLREEDIDLIRDGMWGVVNHRAGTAGSASMRNPVVYGKTGTSQWATGGRLRSLAWFSGWVDADHPRIAFAAVTMGDRGESLSGGRSAGPIAAGFLQGIYKAPESYAVQLPEGPSRDVPSIVSAAPAPEEIVVEIAPEEPKIGGFFRRLFGGGRRAMRNPTPTFP